ncbi:hypothetical protein DMJ13_03695 [halophilic archaeon]|nr:hypothetical protein DMJ13_03695 [halophilic archaeon]
MDTSTIFRLLGRSQRRHVLLELGVQETTAGIAQDGDGGLDIDATYSGPRKLELEHCHLPKLVDNDVIEWNRETNTVTRGPKFDALEAQLRLLRDEDSDVPDG